MSRVPGKFCPICHRTFPSDRKYCPLDGTELTPLPSVLPEDVPVELNYRYLLLRVLGRGGMGVIYKAHDTITSSPVAIKVLKPELTGRELTIQRFFVEARAAKRLNHPNIVQIQDYGVSNEGYLFIAMELLSGHSLAKLLDAGEVKDIRFVLRVAWSIAEALAHAHAKGVVHRDLKPDNIMVMQTGTEVIVKVLDFGVAAILDTKNRGLLYKGEVIGTPAYMSPEQVQGRMVDGRSDIYSLGVLLYEMLTGRVPFYHDDPFETMKMHLKRPIPPLGSLEAPYWLSQSLEALIRKLLAKRREDRPPDASLVAHSLERLLARYEAEAGAWDPQRILQVLSGDAKAEDLHEMETLILPGGDERLHEQRTLVVSTSDPSQLTKIEGFDGESATVVVDSPGMITVTREPVGVWTVSRGPKPGSLPQGKETILVSLVHAVLEFEEDGRGMLGTRELLRPELDAFERVVMSRGGLVCFDSGDVLRILFGIVEKVVNPAQMALEVSQDLLDRLKRFTKGTGRLLNARIGVSTGRIPKKGFDISDADNSIRGSKVDLAVRLASMAPSFGIFADTNTVQLSKGPFECHRIGRIRIRGQERFDQVFRVQMKAA